MHALNYSESLFKCISKAVKGIYNILKIVNMHSHAFYCRFNLFCMRNFQTAQRNKLNAFKNHLTSIKQTFKHTYIAKTVQMLLNT